MELIEGIRSRRSIRRFKPEPLERQLISEIAADAAYAPSWKNGQTVRYIYTDRRQDIEAVAGDMVLGSEFNRKNLLGAPGLMLLCYLRGKSGFGPDGSYASTKGEGFEMFDAGCAAEAFCLAAHARGVGTVITGIFHEGRLKEYFALPQELGVACLIYMGLPDESPAAPARLGSGELLSFR